MSEHAKAQWNKSAVTLLHFGATINGYKEVFRNFPEAKDGDLHINNITELLKFSFVRDPISRQGTRSYRAIDLFLIQILRCCGAEAYQLGNTSSRMITELKQRELGYHVDGRLLFQVLPECCC